ncbi:hypothetical protein DFR29_106131 [Tahibacter aquaticus]|uniref:Uncharacterized protein n=1 Tax=Tahibacter aquaticus TaxID=520092 RepID=A0A4R6YYF0_9GAMM|nr:hypothetical protein [Tahibacter aquaticus]TDR43986.1 hypothetical protein DFR29_106131 [Tahibacter aquaticus]
MTDVLVAVDTGVAGNGRSLGDRSRALKREVFHVAIDTNTFPTISLQLAAVGVWKTSSVITDEMNISVPNRIRVDHIIVDKVVNFGNAWADWWYQNPPDASFSIDMSIVS